MDDILEGLLLGLGASIIGLMLSYAIIVSIE